MPHRLTNSDLKQFRILIVDDQPANLQVLGSILGQFGMEIIPASDGPTALKRLFLRPPDLILLDLLMPIMDGIEVCRRIREHPASADIPVIFLSAIDEKGLVIRALESGAVDFVTKPFNQTELLLRVRTHLALKSARDQLRKLATDRDELLGILTHDLSGGLGGVHISAQVLLSRLEASGPVDPKLLQLSDNILNSSVKLLAFVKEFVANNRAEHGLSLSLSPTPTPVVALIRGSASQHEEVAARKQIKLLLELPSSEISALADAEALTHVMDNLISNAIKFSPRGSTVRIGVRRETDGRIACTVADQGPGFTDEDRARMFGRYERLSARPTAGEPSTGLGLSIVKRLVDAMSGEIVCEPPVNQGAVFTVRLAPAA